MTARPAARLYVPDDLGPGLSLGLAAGQAHYLRRVLRLGGGAEIALFNGRDGEWRVAVPDVLRLGHDAHFIGFTRRFLRHVAKPGTLKRREKPNLLAKYHVTTEGVALSHR